MCTLGARASVSHTAAMNACPHKGSFSALCMLLCLAATPCRADDAVDAVEHCSDDCQSARLIQSCWQPASAYPASLTPRPRFGSTGLPTEQPASAVIEWQPPDTHWITRIKQIRELPLVTLWKSPSARVFLGVNENGLAGLAISSRRPAGGRKQQPDTTGAWRLEQESLIYY